MFTNDDEIARVIRSLRVHGKGIDKEIDCILFSSKEKYNHKICRKMGTDLG